MQNSGGFWRDIAVLRGLERGDRGLRPAAWTRSFSNRPEGLLEPAIRVLGGTGLLGVPVVRRLRPDGFRVRVLTRRPDEARRVLDPTVHMQGRRVARPPNDGA